MVIFVMNCLENLGVWGYGGNSSVLCNRGFFVKSIFPCNYIKTELKIQRCLCMYHPLSVVTLFLACQIIGPVISFSQTRTLD